MEVLTDVDLLMVMEYLDVEDIFACRLASKRLAGLALHTALWRHHSFSGDRSDDKKGWPCPVLRIAPCLKSLRITSSHRCSLLSRTKCAVEKLCLEVTSGDVMQCVLAIRNQEVLGRLKHLELRLCRLDRDATARTRTLLEMLVDVSGLEELHVSGLCFLGRNIPSLLTPVVESSLKRFSWTVETSVRTDIQEPIWNVVLATHAATLEEVDIRFPTSCYRSEYLATTSLLARMPCLRVLRCYSLPGLEAVAACESLREVTLNMYSMAGTDKEAAIKFLCRATQLRKVELIQFLNVLGGELLLSLASSGRSAVESLKMFSNSFKDNHGPTFVEPVLRALPSLPSLRDLELHVEELDDPNKLLSSLTPARAPALQTVRLIAEEFACLHRCMPNPLFKGFLLVNPTVQVVMDITKECGDLSCYGCSLKSLLHTLKNWRSDKVNWLSVVIDHEKSAH